MTYYRHGRKRLQIDIPEGVHRWIKQEAAKRGITVTRFVLQMLLHEQQKIACTQSENTPLIKG